MKFLIATIFTLALASYIQCSVLPLHGHGHGIALVTSPGAHVVAAHAPASVAVHASAVAHPWGAVAPWGISPWGGALVAAGPHGAVVAGPHHAVVAASHHAVVAAPHHAAVVAAAPHQAVVVSPHHAHEGSYVAQTRGAVHSAPLAGHASSAASINVAPAPGTV